MVFKTVMRKYAKFAKYIDSIGVLLAKRVRNTRELQRVSEKASLSPCCRECLWAGALGRVSTEETKLTAAAVLGG